MSFNKSIYFGILTFMISVSSHCADDVIPGQVQEVTASTDKMKQLLEIPAVQKFYDMCVAANSTAMDTCVWGYVKADDSLRAQVNEVFNKETDVGSNKAYEKSSLGKQLKRKQSKSLAALQAFYTERLNTALYGEEYKDGKLVKGQSTFVDHTKFNDLYRSQLGKNIITSMSSYCIEADKDLSFLIFKDPSHQKNIREINKKKLQTTETITNKEGVATQTIGAYKDWNDCITILQNICHYKGSDSIKGTTFNPKTECTEAVSHSATKPHKCTPADLKYSKKRACEVVQYLKSSKQNLVSLDKIDKIYADRKKENNGIAVGNVKMAALNKEGERSDDLVSITSNEFKNKSGYATAKIQEVKKFEECYTSDGVTEQIVDTEACKDFLSTDRDAANRAIAEAKLRTESIEAKLKTLETEGTEDDVKSYLVEQGYTEDEIESKFDLSSIELKKEIVDKYREEKAELIESMRAKIEGSTTAEEGSVTASQTGSNDGDEDKLADIKMELTQDTENYTELIHYNNIVSSYLEIGKAGGDGKTKRNTASAFRELEDSAYDQDASSGDTSTAQISQALEASKLEKSSDSGKDSQTVLGVNQINEILEFENTKDKKTQP